MNEDDTRTRQHAANSRTRPAHRWVAACTIALQLSATLALAAPLPGAARVSGRSFSSEDARARITSRAALELTPIPFPAPAPDPLSADLAPLALAAEEAPAPAGEDAPEADAPEASPSKAAWLGGPWWVWTGSAALVGLFVAGFAHDLSKETGPPPELPDFPDTP